ncbi:MAG: hypothetical protein KDA65_14645 [Planctomycetaceae bacterium]|nr:hypothetical protein [Planctomycetaceae bacterium]
MSTFTTRQGYTLIELVVSVAASSMLVLGLGSSLYLAGQAVAPSEVLEDTLIATEALHNLTDDVQNAIYLSEHTDKAIEFVVRDMDGDGSPDVIRYEWGGTPGDPLLKKINYGTAVEVIDHVESFELKYNTRSTTEYFPPSLVESAEQLLGGDLITFSGTQKVRAVESASWPGFYFTPSLGAGAEGWNVTKVKLGLLQYDGSDNGTFYLQMRPATSDHLPTSEVLEQQLVQESSLSTVMTLEEFDFAVKGLLPTDRLCGVLQHDSGTYSAKVKYDNRKGNATRHQVESMNSGASWLAEEDELVFHEIWGTYYSEAGSGMTVIRDYYTGLNASLQLGDTTASLVRTGIPLLNSPELLSGLWELDFDTDPTAIDANFDNLNDWTLVGGGTFDTDTLSFGVWDADSTTLRTSPDQDFTQATTVVVRMRATTTGGSGAVFEMRSDWNSSNAFVVRLRAVLETNNTQTYYVESQSSPGVWSQVVKVENLPTDFLEARMVISPNDMNHAQFLQGNLLDNYTYTRVSADTSKKYAALYESGCDAEFDYVSIRVTE